MRWQPVTVAVALVLVAAPEVLGAKMAMVRSISSRRGSSSRKASVRDPSIEAGPAISPDDDEPSWAADLKEERVRQELQVKEKRERQEKEERKRQELHEEEKRERQEEEERKRQELLEKEKHERQEEELKRQELLEKEKRKRQEEERKRQELLEKENNERQEEERKRQELLEKEKRERQEKEERKLQELLEKEKRERLEEEERKRQKQQEEEKRERQEEERKRQELLEKEKRERQKLLAAQSTTSGPQSTMAPTVPATSISTLRATIATIFTANATAEELDQGTPTAPHTPADFVPVIDPESEIILFPTTNNSHIKDKYEVSSNNKQDRETSQQLKQRCDAQEDGAGYVRVPFTRSRYKAFAVPRDWASAEAACARDGAHLAVANGEKEAMALVFLLRATLFPFHPTHMHVGVSDSQQEGDWRAIDGSELSKTYVRWAPNQPEINNRKQNCMQLYTDLTNVDFNCEGKALFVCEKSLHLNS